MKPILTVGARHTSGNNEEVWEKNWYCKKSSVFIKFAMFHVLMVTKELNIKLKVQYMYRQLWAIGLWLSQALKSWRHFHGFKTKSRNNTSDFARNAHLPSSPSHSIYQKSKKNNNNKRFSLKREENTPTQNTTKKKKTRLKKKKKTHFTSSIKYLASFSAANRSPSENS